MKTIMVNNNMIISLENVKAIHYVKNTRHYTSDPCSAEIRVEYMTGAFVSTGMIDDRELVKSWFDRMYEILKRKD